MEKIKIRKAKVSDLARVRYVTRQAYRLPIIADGFVTGVSEPQDLDMLLKARKLQILVAEVGGKTIGSVRCEVDKGSIYIYKLAVLKTYRRHGVAARLMAGVEKFALADGYTKLKLDCAEEKGLTDYYKKLGFNVYKIVDHGFYHGVYMEKKIK